MTRALSIGLARPSRLFENQTRSTKNNSNGNLVWICGHSDLVFMQWNHTKALFYCIGGLQQPCKNMSTEWRSIYATIHEWYSSEEDIKVDCRGRLPYINWRVEEGGSGVPRSGQHPAPASGQISPRKPPNVDNLLSWMSDLSEQGTPLTPLVKRDGGIANTFGRSQDALKNKKGLSSIFSCHQSSKNNPKTVVEWDTAISHFLAANSSLLPLWKPLFHACTFNGKKC